VFPDRIGFRFDVVFFDSLDSNRLKSAVADVQRDLRDLNAARSQPIEKRGRKVQAGGGRRYRASLASKDSLIAVGVEAIFFIPFDVGRQRRAADAIGDVVEVAVGFEANYPAAEIHPFHDFSGEFSAGELDARARQQRSSRLDQRLPDERLESTYKKHFDVPAQHGIAARSCSDSSAD